MHPAGLPLPQTGSEAPAATEDNVHGRAHDLAGVVLTLKATGCSFGDALDALGSEAFEGACIEDCGALAEWGRMDARRAARKPQEFGKLLDKLFGLSGVLGQAVLDRCGDLEVAGSLDIKGWKGLVRLPEKMKIKGSLDLANCPDLAGLPEGLKVAKGLSVENCESLRTIGKGVRAGGCAKLTGCHGLVALDGCLKASEGIVAVGCDSLKAVKAGFDCVLEVRGCREFAFIEDGASLRGLFVEDCPSFTGMGAGVQVGDGFITVIDCPKVKRLGWEGMSSHVRITRCPGLEALEIRGCNGSLDLWGCESLRALGREGERFFVGHDLRIGWCPSLRSLPDGMEAQGGLTLNEGCGVVCLPKRLQVTGSLRIEQGCSWDGVLPDDLYVGCDLTLGRTVLGRSQRIMMETARVDPELAEFCRSRGLPCEGSTRAVLDGLLEHYGRRSLRDEVAEAWRKQARGKT